MKRLPTMLSWLLLLSTAFAQYVPTLGTAPASGGPSFTYVTQTSNSGSCAAVTCALTPSAGPANGDLLIVDYFCHDTTVSQPPSLTTDNGTSTWANAFAYTDGGNWYENADYTLAAAGAPTTFTVHCGAATDIVDVTIREYNRTSGSWIFGGAAAQAFGTSATATGASVTPTASIPALVCGWFLNKSANSVFTTANTTIRANVGDVTHGEEIGSGDQIIASASTSYAASATLASGGWTAITYWFK
jgi:hypothetical protein